MTIRKTMTAIAAPFALAAVIGGTAVFAQSADETPSTDAPPATAPDEATPGKTHDGKDCPRDGSDTGADTANLY